MYTTAQGNVTTPGFPSLYPNNNDCKWLIQVPDGHIIHLSFIEPFSLEDNSKCDADYLELYDYTANGDLLRKGRWCGHHLPPLQTSTSSRMLLVFHSDSAKNYKGFQASWESDKTWTCGNNFVQAVGHLSSPSHPLTYPEYQDCRWEISPTPDEANDVTLHFDSSFEIEESPGCIYDYIEIYRDDDVLGRWCGTDIPPDVTSNGHTLVIIFKSDKSGTGKGFTASWG